MADVGRLLTERDIGPGGHFSESYIHGWNQ
jgi:hypothetical protein